MRTYSIIFSPTGGTEKVVRLLGAEFSIQETIDLSENKSFAEYCFTETDVCLIGVPVFGGRVPATAVARLRQLKGNGARAVLVAVYGNRAYEDALLELKETACESGFRAVAAVAAVAEHSIVRRFGTGRPDAKDGEELRQFAVRIREALAGEQAGRAVAVPGNVPYRKHGGSVMLPKAGADCTKCGVCAEKCPVGAISREHPSRTDGALCISCMRCIAVCPQHSRKLEQDMLEGLSQRLETVCGERKKNELFLAES